MAILFRPCVVPAPRGERCDILYYHLQICLDYHDFGHGSFELPLARMIHELGLMSVAK